MKNEIRKIVALVLSLIMTMSLFGCEKNNDEKDNSTVNSETVETNQISNSPYAEDQVLFYAQNKYRVEEDSHIIHFYNYKGDLLSSNDTSRMSLFYIPSYNKFGLSAAYDFLSDNQGYVNEKGEFVINPQYSLVFPFSKDGLALVTKNIEGEESWQYTTKFGYVDYTGKEVIPLQYDYATSFYECGLAIVGIGEMYVDCKLGVIDKKGNSVIEKQYDNICDIEGDFIICHSYEADIYHIYNLSGELVYECNLEENNQLGDYLYCQGENIFSYSEETKIIYIFNGNEFTKYDDTVIDEYTRIITAEESGRGCGVSYKGENVIPCEYQDIIYSNGYYIAENSHLVESYDIYNENFEKTAEDIEYDLTEYIAYSKYCSLPEGYFYIIADDERDGTDLYGIIDYTGKIIVEPVFSDQINVNTYEITGYFRRTNESRPI